MSEICLLDALAELISLGHQHEKMRLLIHRELLDAPTKVILNEGDGSERPSDALLRILNAAREMARA